MSPFTESYATPTGQAEHAARHFSRVDRPLLMLEQRTGWSEQGARRHAALGRDTDPSLLWECFGA